MQNLNHPTYVLGIDTSCDETSAAVLKNGQEILSNIISSQGPLHEPHGGIVPEIASRSHIEKLPAVIDQALKDAAISCKDLTGIAVTTSPGLIGCLLVGLSYAKAMAYQLRIPLAAVNHLKGHLFSPLLEHATTYPFLGLVISGGHTALYHVKSFDSIACLGQTVDDAVGEAYDKVAKLLELGYPGGPLIDRLSGQGNEKAYAFTPARVKKGPLYFSFSGLKTAVKNLVQQTSLAEKNAENFKANVAAAFQKTAIDSLMISAQAALSQYPVRAFAVSGGVAANSRLREQAGQLCHKNNIPLAIPKISLCTDNGAMIAYVGARQLENNQTAPLNCQARPTTPVSAPL